MVLLGEVPVTSSEAVWAGKMKVYRFTDPSPHAEKRSPSDVQKLQTSMEVTLNN
jgi:hypothetical protein